MNQPILFIVFNRPNYAKEVFEEIRKAKPSRLYIAGDGAREGKAGEQKLVLETRKIVESIDWDCEVKTLFQEKNLGCGLGVATAISWFFENEQEGIILEDDCKPHPSFFRFCEELLEKYRDNMQVGHIAGTQELGKININESYAFTFAMHCWGWASWANR